MNEVVIRVENLTKIYKLIQDRSQSLYNRILNILKFKNSQRSIDYIKALDNISFEVKLGEILGIIGKNGAGKTTLLKILSKITEPTQGKVEIKGRIGTLLAIGTGFHPELTGRENIYLSGIVLGMKKKEINKLFNDIVDFAEIDKFIDTPVKYYSTGMSMRLAFSVAAHLQTDILLVDEILAVGDVAFQKKCFGKMGNVAKEGRTILFVSHNMTVLSKLCQNGLLLDNGKIIEKGSIDKVIKIYTETLSQQSKAYVSYPIANDKPAQILSVQLLDYKGQTSLQIERTQPFSIEIQYAIRQKLYGIHIGVSLDKADGTPVCHTTDIDNSSDENIERHPGIYKATVKFPASLFNYGMYQIRIGIAKYGSTTYDYCEPFIFDIIETNPTSNRNNFIYQRGGVILLPFSWKIEKLSGVTLSS